MANNVSPRPVGISRSDPRDGVSVWRTEYADDELQVAPLPALSLKPLVAVAPERRVDAEFDAVAVPLVVSVDCSLLDDASVSVVDRSSLSSATRSLAARSRRARSRALSGLYFGVLARFGRRPTQPVVARAPCRFGDVTAAVVRYIMFARNVGVVTQPIVSRPLALVGEHVAGFDEPLCRLAGVGRIAHVRMGSFSRSR